MVCGHSFSASQCSVQKSQLTPSSFHRLSFFHSFLIGIIWDIARESITFAEIVPLFSYLAGTQKSRTLTHEMRTRTGIDGRPHALTNMHACALTLKPCVHALGNGKDERSRRSGSLGNTVTHTDGRAATLTDALTHKYARKRAHTRTSWKALYN